MLIPTSSLPLPSPPLPSPQVSYQAYGDTVTVDLKPGGKDIRVTKGNREGEVMGKPPFLQALSPAQVPFPLVPPEFVSLYTDFLLNKSVYNQFASFFYGFHRVCTSNALQVSACIPCPTVWRVCSAPSDFTFHLFPPLPSFLLSLPPRLLSPSLPSPPHPLLPPSALPSRGDRITGLRVSSVGPECTGGCGSVRWLQQG